MANLKYSWVLQILLSVCLCGTSGLCWCAGCLLSILVQQTTTTTTTTNSIEQSPSWEVNRSSANQEISSILWNPKVQYYIPKCPPPLLYWDRATQSMPPPPISSRSILILLTHLCLDVWSHLFLSGLPTKTLYVPLLFGICATCTTYLILLWSVWSGTDRKADDDDDYDDDDDNNNMLFLFLLLLTLTIAGKCQRNQHLGKGGVIGAEQCFLLDWL